jgi:hypothetical protein
MIKKLQTTVSIKKATSRGSLFDIINFNLIMELELLPYSYPTKQEHQ